MTAQRLRDTLLPWATPLRPARAGDWLSENFEKGQSLSRFKVELEQVRQDEHSRLGPSASRAISVFWIDPAPERLPEAVTAGLGALVEDYFPGTALRFPETPSELRAPLDSRGTNPKQLSSNAAILLASQARAARPDFAVVLVTGMDLFSNPDDSDDWIFGQTRSRGDEEGPHSGGIVASWNRCAVEGVSSLADNRRFVTVLLHELGHGFYLDHCVSFDCLMNGFNQDWELDAQSLHLCPECHAKLFEILRFDPLNRFRALEKAFRARKWLRDASAAANLRGRVREKQREEEARTA